MMNPWIEDIVQWESSEKFFVTEWLGYVHRTTMPPQLWVCPAPFDEAKPTIYTYTVLIVLWGFSLVTSYSGVRKDLHNDDPKINNNYLHRPSWKTWPRSFTFTAVMQLTRQYEPLPPQGRTPSPVLRCLSGYVVSLVMLGPTSPKLRHRSLDPIVHKLCHQSIDPCDTLIVTTRSLQSSLSIQHRELLEEEGSTPIGSAISTERCGIPSVACCTSCGISSVTWRPLDRK